MGAKMLPAVGLAEDRRATEKTGRKSADDGEFARELGNAVACGNNVSPQEGTAGETSSVEGNTADSGGKKESGNGRSDDQAGNTSDFSGLLLVMAALAAGQLGAVRPATELAVTAGKAQISAAAVETSAAKSAVSAVAGSSQSADPAAVSGKEPSEPGSAAVSVRAAAVTETGESGPAAAMPDSKEAAPAEAVSAEPAAEKTFAAEPALPDDPQMAVGLPGRPASAWGGAHGTPTSEKSVSPIRAAPSGSAGANQKTETADIAAVREQPATERKTAVPSAESSDGRTQAAQWPAAAVRSPAAAGVGQVSREDVSEQTGHVARQIASALQGDPDAGRSQLRVHLSPADLGGINLRLLTENGRVTLQITADSSHTGALLSSHLDELNRSLTQSGVTMDRTEVFCQTGGGESGASGGWPGGAPPGFGGTGEGGGTGSRRGTASGAAAVGSAVSPAGEKEDPPPRAAPGRMSFFA